MRPGVHSRSPRSETPQGLPGTPRACSSLHIPEQPKGEADKRARRIPAPPPPPLQGRCRAARNGRGPAPTAAADHSREPHRGWAARRAPHAPSRSPSSPQDRGSETVRARPRSHSDGAGTRPGAAPDPPRRLRRQDPPRRRDPRPAPLASPHLTARPSSRPASLASARAPLASPRAPLASPPLTSHRSSRLHHLTNGGPSRGRPSTGPAPRPSSREKSRPTERPRRPRITPSVRLRPPHRPGPPQPVPCGAVFTAGNGPAPGRGEPRPLPAANPVLPGARDQRAVAAFRVRRAST